MRQSLMGRASSFAHFAGLGGKRRAEDPPKDDEPKDGKAKAAEGDDEDEKPKDGRKSRAEDNPTQYPDDDDAPKGTKAVEDDDEPKDDEPKGRKSRASDDDETCEEDDDEEEMTGKSAAASARRRERARCATIFGHAAAAENPQLACSLAFETTLTRQGALAVLKSQAGRAAPKTEVGAGREARNARLGSAGAEPTGRAAVKATWDASIAKVVPGARKK